MLNTLHAIVGAGFKSLVDNWADTIAPHGKLMLTVLGGLAEYERHLIPVRTSEGRARARARGVKFGRKPSLTDHQMQEALARRAAGEACVLRGVTSQSLDRIEAKRSAVQLNDRAYLSECSENVRRNPQAIDHNYLAPIARRNRIEIMTAPTSWGVRGLG